MCVIVCILLADSMHGRSKFVSIIRFGGCLNVGQQCERELWDTNDDAIHGHSCRKKVKCLVDHLSNCSNTSFVDGQWAPLITTFMPSPSQSVKSSMLLWSLPSAVHRMASVISLPTSFDTASTTPSFAPMTD